MDEDALGELAGEGEHFLVLKGNRAVRKGKKGVIGALFNVLSRMKLGTALTNDNFACVNGFAAKRLYTEAFGDRITSELGRTACFTMCHTRES